MFAWIFLSFRNEVPVIELDQNWRIFSCWRIPYHVHDCYHQQVIKWVLGTYQSPKAIPLKYNDINSKLFLFFFSTGETLEFWSDSESFCTYFFNWIRTTNVNLKKSGINFGVAEIQNISLYSICENVWTCYYPI